MFEHLCGTLDTIDAREIEARDFSKFRGLEWDEWQVVEHSLRLIFNRRRWPVDKMIHQLQSNWYWQEWADNHDPRRMAIQYEQVNETLHAS